jgi:hypothetical protein
MLAVAYWYDSGTFWTAVGSIATFIALLGTAIGLIFNYRSAARRSISYGMLVSTPLISAPPDMKPGLSVRHRGKELADPRLLEIRLIARGHRDIPSSSFDQGRPLCLNLGIPIADLLQTKYEPELAPLPKVEADGTALKVGPSLIRKQQVITLTVLAEGPDARLSCENPLIDIPMRPEVQYQARQGQLKRIITWATVIFIVYYLVTAPTSASTVIHHFYNGLHSVGQSLARFINTL